ncbi:MAG: 30S ribosomal protein S4 [Lentisphaerae bacterium ADurb.BinA184]|nr:MAG: 30S ribosomal protein S4 [Lentisphaerae bacterium ADurb.BinA184]
MESGPKHKLCRRLGSCVWGSPKCPSVKRPYAAGANAKTRRKKLSIYGELMQEKQRLRAHYALTERQLRFIYQKAKKAVGSTPEKLLRDIECRLASLVYRSGLAPSIFAAKQAVAHRHVLVDGKVVNRIGYRVKPGQVITISAERSPSLATIAQNTDVVPPPYLEVDRANCKATLAREPLAEEIPANVEIMRVVEYYAR